MEDLGVLEYFSLFVFSYINWVSLLSHEAQGTELYVLQSRFVAEPSLQIALRTGRPTVYPISGSK